MEKLKIKISELQDLLINNEVYIDTPEGISEISKAYRKSGPGKHIKFTDNSEIICANEHLMCDDNLEFSWKDAKSFKLNDYICNKQIANIEDVKIQDWYDFTVENESQSYYHNGIVHHNSGKSLLLFMFYKFCLLNNIKMLITVPSTSLAEQLKSDFKDYVGTEKEHLIDESVATLYAGQDKNPDVPCIISTWQTCSKMQQEWLEQFGFYACDEAHGADATEITKIIDALGNCKYRIGLTGTLDGSHLHELEMKARFGSVFKMVTTRELIDRGILTEIAIKSLKLNYHKEERKLFHKVVQKKYQREIDYLIEHEHRNKLILNTAMEAEGNTLMLFNRIEGHGMVLYKEIEDMCERAGKRLYMIHGKIKPTEREIIRKKMDEKPELFGRKLTIDGFVYHFRLDEDLKLVNGLSKNVKDINIDDDVDIDWLVSNQEKYKDFKR